MKVWKIKIVFVAPLSLSPLSENLPYMSVLKLWWSNHCNLIQNLSHNIFFIVQISVMISVYEEDYRLLIFLVLISWIWLDVSFQTYRHLLNGNVEAQKPSTKQMLCKHTTCEQSLSRDGGTLGAAVLGENNIWHSPYA